MTLATFSVVVLGDSFPVQSIKTSDFKFRHRDLKETMRVPVALQAENAFVTMQVLPERFEVGVKTADHLEEQIGGVTEMLDVFLEYAGKRTITALGHNAQWVLKDSSARKSLLGERLTDQSALSGLIGSDPGATDIVVRFDQGSATQCQMNLVTAQPGDAFLHFNFHYDLAGSDATIESAVSGLAENLGIAKAIGERAAQLATGVSA